MDAGRLGRLVDWGRARSDLSDLVGRRGQPHRPPLRRVAGGGRDRSPAAAGGAGGGTSDGGDRSRGRGIAVRPCGARPRPARPRARCCLPAAQSGRGRRRPYLPLYLRHHRAAQGLRAHAPQLHGHDGVGGGDGGTGAARRLGAAVPAADPQLCAADAAGGDPPGCAAGLLPRLHRRPCGASGAAADVASRGAALL